MRYFCGWWKANEYHRWQCQVFRGILFWGILSIHLHMYDSFSVALERQWLNVGMSENGTHRILAKWIYGKWGTVMIHPQVLRFSLNFPTKKHGLKSNLRWLPNQSFLIWTRHLRGWFLKGPRAARLSINLSGRLSSSNSLLSPGIFPEAHYKGPAHNLALC